MQQQSDKTMISQNRVSYHNGQKILSATYTSKFAKKKSIKQKQKNKNKQNKSPFWRQGIFLFWSPSKSYFLKLILSRDTLATVHCK